MLYNITFVKTITCTKSLGLIWVNFVSNTTCKQNTITSTCCLYIPHCIWFSNFENDGYHYGALHIIIWYCCKNIKIINFCSIMFITNYLRRSSYTKTNKNIIHVCLLHGWCNMNAKWIILWKNIICCNNILIEIKYVKIQW